MLQNSLREQFEAREKQLFELHLQLNGSSRNLFEDLLRKNNEIIKLCLNSFSDAAARLDEHDAAFLRLDDEMARMGDTQTNFHFEFRRTHLEAEKKQTQLASDISMIKNALKIPGRDALPEVYLSSDFFRARASKVLPRGNTSQGRARTNFFYPQPRLKEEAEAASECLQSKSIQTEKEDLPPPSFSESQREASHQQKPLRKHAFTTMIEEGTRESLESTKFFLSKEEFRTKLNEVEVRVEERLLEAERCRRDCEWNHLDFDELHSYIDTKIAAQLSAKVDAEYLQESLANLKLAWEGEERELFLQLEGKAEELAVRQLAERVDDLAEQIAKARPGGAGSRANLNRSLNCFVGLPSSRPASRDNLAESQTLCRESHKEEKLSSTNNSMLFSNSLGTLKSARKEKHLKIDSLGELGQTATITQQAWKERVSELLGKKKAKRRQ